jgi:FtsP/CotA-like multicopper oxidase with cupredoxin domain
VRLKIRLTASLLISAVIGCLCQGPGLSAQSVSTTQQSTAQKSQGQTTSRAPATQMRSTTAADRKAAAARAASARAAAKSNTNARPMSLFAPRGMPDYFGTIPNYANSPLPIVVNGTLTGGIRKFVDSLPGLGLPGCDPATNCNANNLGNYIPVAIADQTTFPGSDYYQIGVFQYSWQFHSDLPSYTLVRGYRDLSPTGDGRNHYLGPFIIAQRERPVRVKLVNNLPTGMNGDLFLPTDTSVMGAGNGPTGERYTQNRAVLHLHGGNTPWISDGTPHQWITPAGESTPYKKGLGFQNVPDMVPGPVDPTPSDGDGIGTYYYTNQQSSRLMWYHDHSYGLTRLNVYAGEVAGYLLWDQFEEDMISGTNVSGINPSLRKVLPDLGGANHFGIPLVIQDKTFVPPSTQLTAEDPTWDSPAWGGYGALWFSHVYMPNQNPADPAGANAMGRWDYGPWFWPPVTTTSNPPLIHGTVANPYFISPTITPWEPSQNPGIPNPSLTPEAFMDTPVINGAAYPYLQVSPSVYRFRILNGSNDRTFNLQIYYADPAHPTEVKMVPATPTSTFPAYWPTDGRDGGVPDPTTTGPPIVEIGTEGGFLPAPVLIPSTPIGYNYNRRDITVLNVLTHGLLIGPAERADVLVDFSSVPSGSTLILYNDAPAPIPALDPRLDYYTGDPDQTDTGGAPSTLPGYGPNMRTLLQFRVSGAPGTPLDLNSLNAVLPAAFAASQPAPIVPEQAYGTEFGATFANTYSGISDTSLTYTPLPGSPLPTYTPLANSPFPPASCVNGTCTVPILPKAIQELFELNYGRMNATLGVELPFTNFNTQTTIPLGYMDPVTEVMNTGDTQIWKITHNGVDTHFIHFHLFNVQLINRVGWDGMVKPPDANELGWKETVRMNPLEDTIVALRPLIPSVPFDVPNSVRPLDVTSPPNSSVMITSPITGNPTMVNNDPNTNFGWEYVWHCHILGHEENDMMRPMSVVVPSLQNGLAAQITNPWPGSNLLTTSVIFRWSGAIGKVTGYQLLVGTQGPGSSDLFLGGSPSAPLASTVTSQAVSGLPTNAVTINVRLLTQINGAWLPPNDYAYMSIKPSTTLSLTSSLNPSTKGQSVTFTAVVVPSVSFVLNGTVQFLDGDVLIGTALVERPSGEARFSTSALAVGDHAIVAMYSGNVNLAASTSPTLVQVVGDVPVPTFTLGAGVTSGPNIVVKVGSSMPVTVTLTPVNGFAGTIALTCTSPVVGIGCTVASPTVNLTGKPVAASVTISVASTVALATTPQESPSPMGGAAIFGQFAVILAFGGLLGGYSTKGRWVSAICLTLALALIIGGLGACNSSSPNPSPSPSPLVGQHSVTVTATGAGSMKQQVVITFAVQQ